LLFRRPLAGLADTKNARFDTKKARFTAYQLGELHNVCTRLMVVAYRRIRPTAVPDGFMILQRTIANPANTLRNFLLVRSGISALHRADQFGGIS
jgi:hypothetical protein